MYKKYISLTPAQADPVLQEEDEVCVCGKTDVQEPMHFDYTPRWRRESVLESRCLVII